MKYVKKIKKGGFGFGDVLQAAQVTKDVFGIGINLGSLMNLPLDILTGAARAALGQKVHVTYPIPDFSHWMTRIMKAAKGLAAGAGYAPNPTFDVYSKNLILHNMIGQILTPDSMAFDPLDGIKEAAHVQVRAPVPTNILTREVIQEVDPDGFNAIGWMSTGEEWSTLNDLAITSVPQITQVYQDYCYTNRRDWTAYVCATCATQGTFYALENAEGPGSVEYDYTASTKIAHALLDVNLHFPQDLTDAQRARMITWLEAHDAAGTTPTLPEVVAYAWSVCGFQFGVGMLGSGIKFKAFGVKKALAYSGIFDVPKTQARPTVPKEFADIWKRQALSPGPRPWSTEPPETITKP